MNQLFTTNRQLSPTVNPYFHITIFIISFALLLSRAPDRLLNAQLWAEDGTVFYADAYNLGVFPSLFLPYAGYLCVAQRLAAALVQPFPLEWVPAILNVIALIIQIIPVILLTSSRFESLIPNLFGRLFLAFIYLGLPNTAEIYGNISNSQWYLALIACMIVLVQPSSSFKWRFFDLGIVILSALSGPFAIFLIPIAILYWGINRNRWLARLILGMAIGALIQGLALLLTISDARTVEASGANPELFAKILAGQVFLSALIGQNGYEKLVSPSVGYSLLAFLVASLGAIALLYTLIKGPLELQMFILYGILIFCASLTSATVSWQTLWQPESTTRYWFIPMLVFIVSLIWLAKRAHPHWLQKIALSTITIMLIGILANWHHPTLPDLKFNEYAAKFKQALPGTTTIIPVNPTGWRMYLVKR